MRHLTQATAALGAFALYAAAAHAQPPERAEALPESVNVDISDCINLETREQQIACYLARVEEAVEEREADAPGSGEPGASRALNAPSRAVETEARRPDPPAPRQTPQALPQPQREAPAAAARIEEPDEAEREIVATITSLREMEPDAYLITLDNGQVWRQSSPKRYFLREGAEVHLRSTRWGGSYRLTDPDVGNFIQVQRVR